MQKKISSLGKPKKLSLIEFRDLFDSMDLHNYFYNTSNQSWVNIGDSLETELVFDKLSVKFNPNRVTIASNSGTMSFYQVKYILYNNEIKSLNIIDLVCRDRTYTIVAK